MYMTVQFQKTIITRIQVIRDAGPDDLQLAV